MRVNMKIKKKELRKRQAQLPINYPDPEVLPKALPGGTIDLDVEDVQVELLCKRLAHNEVAVRDSVLAEVPRYLKHVTKLIAAMEQEYDEEVERTRAYYASHPSADRLYRYDNIPLALQLFREKAQDELRVARRREEIQALRKRREEERIAIQNMGRYGDLHVHVDAAAGGAVGADSRGVAEAKTAKHGASADHITKRHDQERLEKYNVWMRAWCDMEIIFLKLCRGIHFCLWHSDKPLVQLECAQNIAKLLYAPLSTRSRLLFYNCLFRVLSREWPTIDRYRLDKYLALVRKMVYELFTFVKSIDSAEKMCAESCVPTTTSATAVASVQRSVRRKSVARLPSPRKRPRSSSAVVAPSAPLTLSTLVDKYIHGTLGQKPGLCQALDEICHLFHVQIFPNSRSVGLTMHICDVSFDELCRAFLPTRLFVTLAVMVPLYAMSQGNFVEKRVLDNFFPPIAANVLQSRRTEQYLQAATGRAHEMKAKHTSSASNTRVGVDQKTLLAERAAQAQSAALCDVQDIVDALHQCCRDFATARGTAYGVRAMFSEAELVLAQSRQAELCTKLSATARRRRVEQEIEDVNETRRMVVRTRSAVRELTRKERRSAAAGAAEPSANGAEVSVGESNGRGAALSKTPHTKERRNTKRKKDYKLTREDLYGNNDSDDDTKH